MKTVVITGSTRGIGFGLADSFLARGCQVMVCGRNPNTVEEAAARLTEKHGQESTAGVTCDVTDYEQVQALWDSSVARFGQVDIWINNAGLGNTLTPFWELPPSLMHSVVQTNILGSMYGTSVALRGMLKQGYGALYNMEGFGSRGKRLLPGLTLYGTTKAALAFLDRSVAEELKGKAVIAGSILPGMVVTDLLLNQRSGDPADWERSKKAFNILADRVETIAPWVVDRVLANNKNGAHIAWLNGMKIMGRFLSAPFHQRKLIQDD
ncbi:MAG: SDR family oxidoreductase [Chloroflexi bacterium]|nr:MAG: SDR family oxidoreductase [Chloroflexota bacterium]